MDAKRTADHSPLKLPYVFGQFRLLAMTLLARTPRHAFGAFRSDFFKVVPTDLTKDLVVTCEGTNSYIVLRTYGTQFTTTTLPKDFRDEDVIRLPKTPPKTDQDEAIDLLNGLSEFIRAESPNCHQEYGVSDTLRLINMSMQSPELGEAATQLFASELEEQLHDSLLTDNGASGACGRLIQAIESRFKRLQLEGESASNAVATYSLIGCHPRPSLLCRLGRDFTANLAPEGAKVGVPLGVPFYLEHPYLAGKASFLAAGAAARMLRNEGKRCVRRALSEVALGMFFGDLYSAFLMYRSAQEIYSAILYVGQKNREIWPVWNAEESETSRLWIETEEACATILPSLGNAGLPGFHGGRNPCVMEPEQFFGWLNAQDAGRVKNMIHEMVVRRLCPEWLRDLALLWLCTKRGNVSPGHVSDAQRIVQLLEDNICITCFVGDPAYLYHAYEVLAACQRLAGDEEGATMTLSRANPEHVANFLEAAVKRLRGATGASGQSGM